MAIDRERQLTAVSIAGNINRVVRIIRKTKIHQSLCDRRIFGRIHISNDHGMIVAFQHFQFCI